jgi:peptidoglycan/LPS O-acetylase OafA/YrhL
MLHTRLDILMFGCLAALAVGTPLFERIYAAAARYWWALALEFCVLTNLLASRFGHVYSHIIGMTVDGAASALFLVWCTRNPNHPAGQFLNARAVVWIGWLSYSIYIWQTFFINVTGPAAMLPLILLVACGSWYLIEKPARRIRNRVLRRMRDSHPVEPVPAGAVPEPIS